MRPARRLRPWAHTAPCPATAAPRYCANAQCPRHASWHTFCRAVSGAHYEQRLCAQDKAAGAPPQCLWGSLCPLTFPTVCTALAQGANFLSLHFSPFSKLAVPTHAFIYSIDVYRKPFTCQMLALSGKRDRCSPRLHAAHSLVFFGTPR